MDIAVVVCVLVLAGAGPRAGAARPRAGAGAARPGGARGRRNMPNMLPVYTESDNITVSSYADDNTTPKLRYYYSGVQHYTELPLRAAADILAPAHEWYNASRTTIVFVHGFTGRPDGPAVSALVQAWLQRGDANVALLNWEGMAALVSDSLPGSYLNWAAPNARKLGGQFAETLQRLAAAGMALERTQLVGHSLGAHVLGVAGNTLRARGVTLPWITGLDPAGVAFENKPAAARLHSGSAAVVVALHSDPSKYGIKRGVGSADFWPNFRGGGPVRQPGCPDAAHPRFSPEDLCSHNRSWQLLAEAVRSPGALRGSLAKNYRAWKNYARPEREAVTADLDAYPKTIVPGNYYFTTGAAAPFGLAAEGL